MVLIDTTKKSTRFLMNYDFMVFIDKLTGEPGESEQLTFGVDRVSGIKDAATTMIRYRPTGLSSTSTLPIPGLSTSSAVTLEGIYAADMLDLAALQRWRQECQYKVPTDILGGFYRQVTIAHLDRKEVDNIDLLATDTTLPVSREIVFENCVATSLSLGDLDVNSEGKATWMLEIDFQDMTVRVQ